MWETILTRFFFGKTVWELQLYIWKLVCKITCIVSTRRKAEKSPLASCLWHWVDLHHIKSRNFVFIIQPNTFRDKEWRQFSTFVTLNAILPLAKLNGMERERKEHILFVIVFVDKRMWSTGFGLILEWISWRRFVSSNTWWCADMPQDFLLIISQIKSSERHCMALIVEVFEKW